MKKIWRYTLGLSMILASCNAQETKTDDLLLGEIAPGDSAVLFAPGKLNHPTGYHSSLIFTNDFKTVFFSPMSRYGELHKMTSFAQSDESQKIVFPDVFDAGDPFLSPDNKRLYFLSFQPLPTDSVYRERIWYSEIKNGELREPKVVDKSVYDHPTHWQFSVANNYNLYFTSEIDGQENQDIYLARYADGAYKEPVKLPAGINTPYTELCSYISPDEEYLIFSRSDNTTRKTDLFISYNENGQWSKAEPLSQSINSEGNDLCPVVTPDEKYLFFVSTRDGVSKIYGVTTHFIKPR